MNFLLNAVLRTAVIVVPLLILLKHHVFPIYNTFDGAQSSLSDDFVKCLEQVRDGHRDITDCISTPPDTKQCLTDRLNKTHKPLRIVIAGDSRMRQLWYALLEQVTGVDEDWITNATASIPNLSYPRDRRRLGQKLRFHKSFRKHQGRSAYLEEIGLHSEYHWMSSINDGQLASLLKTITDSSILGTRIDMLIVSHGIWSILTCGQIRKNESECQKQYRRDLIGHVAGINHLPRETTFLWVPQNSIIEDMVRNFTNPMRTLTNQEVLEYNRVAVEVLALSKATVWYAHDEAFRFYSDTPDGLHLGRETKKFDSAVLFSHFCG